MKKSWLKYLLFCFLFLGTILVAISYQNHAKKPYYLSVVAIMKNEKPYLKEWIEYHLLQKVEHFYLCDNDSTDGTKEYLKPYIDKGIITYIPTPGINQQLKCYENVVNKYKNQTYWLAMIDLDEYLVPLQKNNMKSFLKDYEEVSELSLHWQNYGDSGIFKRKEGLITETFTSHAKTLNHTVKSIVKPEKVIDFNTFGANHYTKVEGLSVNEYYKPVKFMLNYNISADKARINHYLLKSFSEFVYKKNRGHPEGTSIDYRYYFFHNDNSIKDEKTMSRFINKLKKRIKKSPLKDVLLPNLDLKATSFDDLYFTPEEASIILNEKVKKSMSFYEIERAYKNNYPSYLKE